MRKKFIQFLTISLLISANSLGQNKSNFQFSHIYASDLGVQSISKQNWDKDGNLWASTDKGILKYNGYQTEFLKHTPNDSNSIKPGEIWLFSKTDPDEFWITYNESRFLSKFNPKTRDFKHYLIDSLNEFGSASAPIVKIYKDKNDQVWLGTWGDGLLKLDQNTGQYKTHKFPKIIDNNEQPSFVTDIITLENGKLLVCFFMKTEVNIAGQ
tara:strand:- start:85 stop:717 length:633 start_codon:yes stop_codon:yes gene_type:complete